MEIYVFCFRIHASEIDTSYIVNEYQKIQTLFSWMGIDSRSMLYGLDHVQNVCSKINALKLAEVGELETAILGSLLGA